jgi:hypothetical protein
MAPRRSWSELPPAHRRGIGGAAVVQVALWLAALVSIRRTPADRVRGPKWAWTLASFVNFIGPLAWFTVGRRR